MVSLKKNISLFFINSLVFICFMGLFSIANAVSCTGSQRPCCKGKEMSCCAHPGYGSNGMELSYDLSGCMLDLEVDRPITIDPGLCISGYKKCCIDGEMQCVKDTGQICLASCDPVMIIDCTAGEVQYKPSGSCGTSSRTCCSDRTWSGWDSECINCSSNQCWNGTICEAKGIVSRLCFGNVANATGGSQTRTATCTKGSGWSYGNWSSSNCTYSGGGSSCTCRANEHLVRYSNGNCCCEFNACGTSLPNDIIGPCKCVREDLGDPRL